jgi:hypothetical protein
MFIYPNVRLSVCPFAVSPYFSWPEQPKSNGQTDIRTFVFLRSISFFLIEQTGYKGTKKNGYKQIPL